MPFEDSSVHQVNEAMQRSWKAFLQYRKLDLRQRAVFLKAIATELQDRQPELVQTAAAETHLDPPRLQGELRRTIFQLQSYAEACAEGAWLDIRIDTADPARQPPKPDLRKMLVPLGPVVVFGASNFPFAYSTAGGDTACALAAGCTVVIKAHPAHGATSQLVAEAVQSAAATCKLPEDVFMHLHGTSFQVGATLVQHPLTRAVGFTGSFEGGKALFDLAVQRPVPIPVFAEMGSVNPVFFLPQKLQQDPQGVAAMYAGSITQSAGQFCTNPGLLVALEGPSLSSFREQLGLLIRKVAPAEMLHPGIAKNFHSKRTAALAEAGVSLVAVAERQPAETESLPTVAEVKGDVFLSNPRLHKEVFGPFSLLIVCRDMDEMLHVARSMEGQLTATLIATDEEMEQHPALIEALQDICGRLVVNGVPTGVEVVLAMQHGGPYPATTDSRFTAVGADGIKRFARPLCFQNWSNRLLPAELRDEYPLGIWRTVNNQLSCEVIGVTRVQA